MVDGVGLRVSGGGGLGVEDSFELDGCESAEASMAALERAPEVPVEGGTGRAVVSPPPAPCVTRWP